MHFHYFEAVSHYVAQAGLELGAILSASVVLGLQTYATTPGSGFSIKRAIHLKKKRNGPAGDIEEI